MKHFAFFLLSACLILFTSCKYLLLRSEGIKQPALESHESLSKFLAVRGIDTSEILCLKDTTALFFYYKEGGGTPDAQFFNREKKFVDYRSSESDCNGKVSVFIEKGDSINLVSPIEGKLLDDYLKNMVVGETGNQFILEDQKYDAYMIVYWAKYVGKLNKRKVYDWQEAVKKANQDGKKMRMILVNVDYQKIWGISKDQVPKFDY